MPSDEGTVLTDAATRIGRAFALSVVAFLFVALPVGAVVGSTFYALRAGESIGGTILDFTVLLPSLVLFGVPGVGVYAVLLGLVHKRRSSGMIALVAFSPLIATGWLLFLGKLAFTSLALSGAMSATIVVFGLMMVGPFRRHLFSA